MSNKISFQYEVDEELYSWLSHAGIDDQLCNEPIVKELLYRAQFEAAESDAGRELRDILIATGRPASYLVERVGYEVAKRWGNSILMKGVPTRARCEEVLADLVTELKPLLPPVKPESPKVKVDLSQEEKPDKTVTFFALMFNYCDRELPASTFTPRGGIITLVDPSTNKKFEYPTKRFDELYNDAVKFRLIDRPHHIILRSF